MENTSLDTCLVLKKSFQKKENFLVHKLEASASEISSLQGTVSLMEQCISEENTNRLQKEAEIKLLNKNLKISKKENEKINIKLSKKEDKLSKFNTRNINKRLNRSKQTNENIKKENKFMETQLLEVQGNLVEVQDQFQKYKKENENLRKKISYWKNRTLKLENQSSEKHIKEIMSLKIKELEQVIKYMENEKCLLKEKIVDHENKKLTLFQKGQYSNNVRAAYQDLVSDGGVSANKVEKVVNIVLTKIAGVQVDRLPKSTYAKDMGIEVRGMAQYHVASELSAESECQNMTLHSDGTTKFGHSYTTFDVQKSDGKLLVVGMREVGAADAQTQMDLFREILGEVCDSLENKDEIIRSTFINIKNLMSDRCAVQKKFNDLFIEFRKNILKNATKNFDSYSVEQQEKMIKVNQFFCGLHYLVGLADQAEACLKVWEEMLYPGQKVGCLSHGGYSNGESGVTRLIRTVCKSVQERGCEKSGRFMSFSTYLKDEFEMASVPLKPFLGNRFNILFVNGLGVYCLYDKLLHFFRRIERNNKLLDAVYWDLEVVAYRAGCRALGLIEKLITGPLWKILATENHILNMSKHYQKLTKFFKECSEDCSRFLRGESFCDPSFINRDETFVKLMEPCSQEIELMTKQCLEIIFGGFEIVTERMLFDHTEKGKYGKENLQLREETQSVATTNVDPERDFGMLDRLMKLKPKALDLAYEGNIMYVRNKTSEWRDKLSEEKLDKALDFAKKSKSKQKAIYFQNKKIILEKKTMKLKQGMEEKEKKQKRDAEEKERLLRELDNFGGLWGIDMVDTKLSNFSSDKEKRIALKIQLNFRQKVIGVKCGKRFFTLSSGGKIKPISEIRDNLIHVIKWNLNLQPESANLDFSKPCIISDSDLRKQKSIFKENLAKQQQKNEVEKVGGKRLTVSKSNGTGGSRKRVKVANEDEKKVPVISSSGELVGKLIDHFCFLEDEDVESWHRGVVLKTFGRKKFLVRYNDCPDEIYPQPLFEEFKAGNVRVVELKGEDLIGASIRHMFEDDETGESIWWNAEVVDLDPDSDPENPKFFVMYDENGEAEEGQQEKQEYYLEPLLGDYLDHCVQIVSLDLDVQTD